MKSTAKTYSSGPTCLLMTKQHTRTAMANAHPPSDTPVATRQDTPTSTLTTAHNLLMQRHSSAAVGYVIHMKDRESNCNAARMTTKLVVAFPNAIKPFISHGVSVKVRPILSATKRVRDTRATCAYE